MPEQATSRPVLAMVLATALAAAVVLAGLLLYLSTDLPDQNGTSLDFPAAGFSFAFGNGYPKQDYMVVDSFTNGYALLSSGPANLQASNYPVLNYTWAPGGKPGEIAFFWRQKGQADKVKKTEIITTGTHLVDLSRDVNWQGEIIEFGFLVAGQADQPVEIGQVSFKPDSLTTRLHLMWQAWTTFEARSQQSINFLQGGDYRQVVSLPILVMAWLVSSVLILSLLPVSILSTQGSTPSRRNLILTYAGVLFLAGWMLLDIRWTANSFRQADLSLQTQSNSDLDGEIYQYVQRLKSDVLDHKAARILIIGDANAVDYYLLRAKYHLLPHSVHTAGRFEKNLKPQALDFVIFFGQPGAITTVPGWSAAWQNALTEVDRSDWGDVYKVGSASE